MLFLTPEMQEVFDKTPPYPDMLFYTSPEMKPISDERNEIDAQLNRTVTDEQYALMQRLVRNFIEENRFEFAYWFAQGWLAALAAEKEQSKQG